MNGDKTLREASEEDKVDPVDDTNSATGRTQDEPGNTSTVDVDKDETVTSDNIAKDRKGYPVGRDGQTRSSDEGINKEDPSQLKVGRLSPYEVNHSDGSDPDGVPDSNMGVKASRFSPASHQPRRGRVGDPERNPQRRTPDRSGSRGVSPGQSKTKTQVKYHSDGLGRREESAARKRSRVNSIGSSSLSQTRYATSSLVPVGFGHSSVHKPKTRAELKEVGRARDWATFCRRKTYLSLEDLSREERPRKAKKGAVTPFALQIIKVRNGS